MDLPSLHSVFPTGTDFFAFLACLAVVVAYGSHFMHERRLDDLESQIEELVDRLDEMYMRVDNLEQDPGLDSEDLW